LILVRVDDIEREWIAPAIMVPISDMLAEHDGADAHYWLQLIELFKHSIGRGTIGTSF